MRNRQCSELADQCERDVDRRADVFGVVRALRTAQASNVRRTPLLDVGGQHPE